MSPIVETRHPASIYWKDPSDPPFSSHEIIFKADLRSPKPDEFLELAIGPQEAILDLQDTYTEKGIETRVIASAIEGYFYFAAWTTRKLRVAPTRISNLAALGYLVLEDRGILRFAIENSIK
ncbi:hypothetical protein ACFLZP_03770 [Patescibacteria group bacterium]